MTTGRHISDSTGGVQNFTYPFIFLTLDSPQECPGPLLTPTLFLICCKPP